MEVGLNAIDEEFVAGTFFLSVASLAWAAASPYRFGSLASIGPGFFPLCLSVALAVIGVALIVRGVAKVEPAPIVWGPVRPLLALAGAILAAAWLLPRAGLATSLLAVMYLTELSGLPGKGWLRWHLFAMFAIALACTIFVGVLGMNLPIFPFW